mmetsp:Transcript_33822/g.101082  ORF Transcript_33822/g.101082 Transcript_33822/m.101082 type:complete len:252 (+) Transcript_33822:307-1062(+)
MPPCTGWQTADGSLPPRRRDGRSSWCEQSPSWKSTNVHPGVAHSFPSRIALTGEPASRFTGASTRSPDSSPLRCRFQRTSPKLQPFSAAEARTRASSRSEMSPSSLSARRSASESGSKSPQVAGRDSSLLTERTLGLGIARCSSTSTRRFFRTPPRPIPRSTMCQQRSPRPTSGCSRLHCVQRECVAGSSIRMTGLSPASSTSAGVRASAMPSSSSAPSNQHASPALKPYTFSPPAGVWNTMAAGGEAVAA